MSSVPDVLSESDRIRTVMIELKKKKLTRYYYCKAVLLQPTRKHFLCIRQPTRVRVGTSFQFSSLLTGESARARLCKSTDLVSCPKLAQSLNKSDNVQTLASKVRCSVNVRKDLSPMPTLGRWTPGIPSIWFANPPFSATLYIPCRAAARAITKPGGPTYYPCPIGAYGTYYDLLLRSHAGIKDIDRRPPSLYEKRKEKGKNESNQSVSQSGRGRPLEAHY